MIVDGKCRKDGQGGNAGQIAIANDQRGGDGDQRGRPRSRLRGDGRGALLGAQSRTTNG